MSMVVKKEQDKQPMLLLKQYTALMLTYRTAVFRDMGMACKQQSGTEKAYTIRQNDTSPQLLMIKVEEKEHKLSA